MNNQFETAQNLSVTTPVFVYDMEISTPAFARVLEAPSIEKNPVEKPHRPNILVKRGNRRRRLANRH